MNFRINMESNLSAAAKADADAVAKVESALRAEQKVLRTLEAQRKAINAASVVDVAVGRKLEAQVRAQKDRVAELTGKLHGLGGGLDPAQERAGALAKALESLSQKAGPIGGILRAIGPGGLAAAAGIGALIVATGLLTLGMRELVDASAKASEQRGDMVRTLQTVFETEEAAEHTYDVIARTASKVMLSQDRAMEIADNLAKAGSVNGDNMVRAIESVGKAEAARKGAGQVIEGIIARSEKLRNRGFGAAGGFFVSLDEMRASGLKYHDLAKQLAKSTGVGMGEAQLALRTGRVGIEAGLKALNAAIDSKLGPIAEKKFYTIGAASQRMRDSVSRLFASMDTTVIGRTVDQMGRFFDDSTVSGHALKGILKGIFDGISHAIEVVTPYAKTFFNFLILTSLKVYNATYPLRKAFHDMFGGSTKGGVEDFETTLLALSDTIGSVAEFVANNAIPIIATAFVLLAPTIWGAATAMASFAASTIVAAAPFVLLGALIWGAYVVWNNVVTEFGKTDWGFVGDKIVGAFAAIGTTVKAIGTAIVDGLIWGVTEGIPRLIAKMGDMAGAALAKFKAVFGIHSPSRVMFEGGANVSEGAAQGIESKEARVRGAMQSTISPDVVDMGRAERGAAPVSGAPQDRARAPVAPAAPATTAAASITNNTSQQSTGPTITIAEGAVQIHGVKNAEQLREEFPRLFISMFEQLGLSMGAGAPV